MKHLFLTLFLNSLCILTVGQNTLILSKGSKKASIHDGKMLGVTLLNEDDKYQNWKIVYECNNDIRENLWAVDSIGLDCIHLVSYDYKVEFHNDTIKRWKISTLKNKDYIVDTIIKSATGNPKFDKMVCKIAVLERLNEKRKIVKYDSVKSFTFAALDIDKNFNLHDKTNNSKKDYFGHGGNVSGKDAGIALLILLPFIIAIEVAKDIAAQVHTYQMTDWKVKVIVPKKKVKNKTHTQATS